MGTATKGQIAKEDLKLYDGVNSTFTRKTSSGGTATYDAIDWVGIDVLQYGTSRNDAAITSALNMVGTTSARFFLSPGAWTITNSITIPDNITLVVPHGATLDGAGTLTINGPLESGRYTIFGSSITINGDLLVDAVLPEWWGADPTGVSTSGAEINLALVCANTALCRRVELAGKYLIETPIRINGYLTLSGSSIGYTTSTYGGSILIADTGLNDNVIDSYFADADNGNAAKWLHQAVIESLSINGIKASQSAGNGIYIWQPGEATIIRNVKIIGCKESGIKLEGAGNPCRMENVSSFDNDEYGIEMDTISQQVSLINVKGDGNTLAMFGMVDCIYASVIDLVACGQENHDIAIQLTDSECTVNIIGGKYHCSPAGTDFVKISTSGSPVINFLGPSIFTYTTIINDTVKSYTVLNKEGGNQTIRGNWWWRYEAAGPYSIDDTKENASGYDFINLYKATAFSVDTLTGGNKGKIIELYGARDTVTIEHDVTKISLTGKQDIILNTGDSLRLYHDGTKWVELSGNYGCSLLEGLERSADPTEPSEGTYVIWMSDGTGKGDDGDIMIASQAGGVTKYGTLFDHSAGAAW